MYLKYNAVLRGLQFAYMAKTYEKLCKGNKYTTTMHCALQALRLMGDDELPVLLVMGGTEEAGALVRERE